MYTNVSTPISLLPIIFHPLSSPSHSRTQYPTPKIPHLVLCCMVLRGLRGFLCPIFVHQTPWVCIHLSATSNFFDAYHWPCGHLHSNLSPDVHVHTPSPRTLLCPLSHFCTHNIRAS